MTAENPGRGDAAMQAVALAGRRPGESLRGIAIDLYEAERVVAGWHRDGWVVAKVLRPARRARDERAVSRGTGPGVGRRRWPGA